MAAMTKKDGALWAAQKAIYAALRADDALRKLLANDGIYDGAPQNAAFPYITFGRGSFTLPGASPEEGAEQEMQLLVWSHQEGGGETRRILDALQKAIRDNPPTIQDHNLVSIQMRSASWERRQDGEHWIGVATFRILTEPKP